MPLVPGTSLGHYEIVSAIGAGGMGEVYKARDRRLKRDVALKVLPNTFATDPERLARFEREAEILASLNHPHIAAIYGLQEAGGLNALVMEFVEGEDLAQRLVRGPIPLDEALLIAKQIAEALEAAHEQGIIHRDLKPANIMVRDDGMVKVLDFGLAKALGDVRGTSSGASGVANAATLTSPAMTGIGVILGTSAYMSPEQAKGSPADKRSDIWAFGCVLYEMLTGERVFEGENVSDTLADVLKREPRWDRLPPTTPPAVSLLLRRCLRKEKRQRLQDGTSVRIEVEDALSGPVGSAPTVSQGRRAALRVWALIGGASLLSGAVIGGLAGFNLKSSPRAAPQPVARLTVTVPPDEEIGLEYRAVAVSPNAAHLVYAARRRGVWQLHLRSIGSLESKVIVGTEGALAPFFSPDSQWIGFFGNGQLKKIPLTGGTPQILADAASPFGGSWAANDQIYFGSRGRSGLWRVSARGGAPQPFTKLQQGEISHRWPQVLPGGEAVLFTSRTGPGVDERQVHVQHVASGERRVLAQGDTGSYVPSGHLVYVQAATGTLVAVPFDLTQLQVGATAPVAVEEGVLTTEGAHYIVSAAGLLAYVEGRSSLDDRTLVWVDRNGKTDPLTAPSRPYEAPRLSPDGDRVAVGTAGAKFDMWVYNLARGDASRVISEGSIQFPLWTPDGKRLTYRATRGGTRNIFWRMVDGSGIEEQLTTGEGTHTPGSWSPNGHVLLFTDTLENDVRALTLADHKVQPFLGTRSERAPRFSPDGQRVAYISHESGRAEIYVQPYPGPGGKWRISTDGGTEPVWNPNGRELFYRSGTKMMAVDITTQPVFDAGKPRELFPDDYVPHPTANANYDVSRDGRRFLMVQRSARTTATATQIVVVLNWHEELKRLVPLN